MKTMFDEQFTGNEEERAGKLYEFMEQKFNEIMIANRQSMNDHEIQKQEIFASINAHSQLVLKKDAEIAELNRQLEDIN